ncbi:MAG TPA: FHA domain-containing protein [Chloroflexota bacterium]
MPDTIMRTFSNFPLVLNWYQWGVVFGFLITLVIATWVFLSARRAVLEATVWKTLAVVACIVGTPAVLARLHAGFATEMRGSLLLLAYFSMAACIGSIGVAIGYLAHRQRLAPGSGETDAERIREHEDLLDRRSDSDAPAYAHDTVVLKAAEPPKPLAFLAITSGPYADTMLALHGGTTKIGRDGALNDHPIDDLAVSSQHLSVRYRDGGFVATDLDSINGTFVNGRRVDRHALAPNDVVQIGTTRLVFLLVPNGRAVAS